MKAKANMPGDDATPPIACTLPPERMEGRIEHVNEALAPAYVRAEAHGDGLTIAFDGTDETLAAVASFVAEESVCCSFATYQIAVAPPHEETRLRITGPEGTTEMFREGLLPLLES